MSSINKKYYSNFMVASKEKHAEKQNATEPLLML